jgi:isoprenylcysteine carboxyl methyltransferase (ICMT) family protein YpbQ
MTFTRVINGKKYRYKNYRGKDGKVKSKYMGKVKEKDKDILGIFPLFFYLLGLIQNAYSNSFDNWISWVVLVIGLGLYFLFYIWYENERSKK